DVVGEVGEEGTRRIQPGLSAGHADAASGEPANASRVLFICTGNSFGSPMAEGWLRPLDGSRVESASAGTFPTTLHPLAVAAMAERDVDISSHQVKHVSVFAGQSFDRVITPCDRARDAGPRPPAPDALAPR